VRRTPDQKITRATTLVQRRAAGLYACKPGPAVSAEEAIDAFMHGAVPFVQVAFDTARKLLKKADEQEDAECIARLITSVDRLTGAATEVTKLCIAKAQERDTDTPQVPGLNINLGALRLPPEARMRLTDEDDDDALPEVIEGQPADAKNAADYYRQKARARMEMAGNAAEVVAQEGDIPVPRSPRDLTHAGEEDGEDE
jgi:hypothetical protein